MLLNKETKPLVFKGIFFMSRVAQLWEWSMTLKDRDSWFKVTDSIFNFLNFSHITLTLPVQVNFFEGVSSWCNG